MSILITEKVVEPTNKEEKKSGTEASALGAGRPATAAVPPLLQGMTKISAKKPLSAALHGTLGSYLRDALLGGFPLLRKNCPFWPLASVFSNNFLVKQFSMSVLSA
jgi:hypothetical protein